MSRKKKQGQAKRLIGTRSEAHTYMELPLSVRTLVRGYVQDLGRLRKLSRDESVPAGDRKKSAAVVEKIENAAPDLEPVVMMILLDDIAAIRGFDKSRAHEMMARPTYYRAKNRLEVGIASALGLYHKKLKYDNNSK